MAFILGSIGCTSIAKSIYKKRKGANEKKAMGICAIPTLNAVEEFQDCIAKIKTSGSNEVINSFKANFYVGDDSARLESFVVGSGNESLSADQRHCVSEAKALAQKKIVDHWEGVEPLWELHKRNISIEGEMLPKLKFTAVDSLTGATRSW